MTVIERPLLGVVDIQTPDYESMGFVLGYARLGEDSLGDGTGSEAWLSWTADATDLKIHRGGSRTGLGIKMDVGRCSFRLKASQDPLNGGTFDVGQTIRVMAGEYVPEVYIDHPEEVIYSEDFDPATTDGWVGSPNAASAGLAGGQACLYTARSSGTANITATKTLSGFTPGLEYTVEAEVYATGSGTKNASVGVTGIGSGSTTSAANVWDPVPSYTFTATGTSHEVVLTVADSTSGFVQVFWDDVSVTHYESTEVIPAQDNRVPIFTGRIADISAAYPFDKGDGVVTPYVTVTASDAVRLHVQTQRYGVRISGNTFETFEERLARLAQTSRAPMVVPVPGEPVEVYGL